MHIKSTILAAVLGLGMVNVAPAVAQQDGAGADDLGEQLYMTYCSTCHGNSAGGAGSLSGLLTVDVPDLRNLSADNHGEFPMLEVIHAIDGRAGVRGHENPMPLFGEMFFSEKYGPYGAEAFIRGQMLSIALYIEGIQE